MDKPHPPKLTAKAWDSTHLIHTEMQLTTQAALLACTRWVNMKLASVGDPPVEDMCEAFKDGSVQG